MRLINADALNQYKFGEGLMASSYADGWDDAIDAIMKDAPTVEPKLKDDIVEAFNLITDQEFEHSDSFWIITPKGKKIEFEKKRPQGEWIMIKNSDGNLKCYECSECGNGHGYKAEFCEKCGADMREEVKS